MARTKAAKPAAELARPAAVGKLFADTSFSGMSDSFGRDESFASTSFRNLLRSCKHAWVLLLD